jgi:O-succinylbenzoate synthase
VGRPQAIDACAVGLEYAEQPCATVEELVELRSGGCPVLVAADESVRKAEDPLRVARAGAADLLVLKVAPLGGVAPALAVAEQCGLPVVVSSALDTAVGLAAGLALAAALPSLPYACGLATSGLMAEDVGDLAVDRGSMAVRAVAPQRDRLTALAAPAARQAWWRDRLRRCAELL